MATLYIVATPIGNMSDISLRAISTLKEVNTIICEDTRVTRKLLDRYEISGKKLIALNDFNEEQSISDIIEILNTEDAALVSDAGTPLISDPGYKLVREAKRKNITVTPIPGSSSVIAALSASGLPTDKFTFLGFLPKSSGKQERLLESFSNQNHTIIIFESPHRIIKTMQTIFKIFGDVSLCAAREITKKFEEINTLPVTKHLEIYEKKNPKGEFTLIFNPSVK